MKYDVAIVGAGPAGSTAAKFLAEKGFIPMRVLQRYPYVANDTIIEAYASSGTVFSPSLQHKIEIHKNTPIIAMILRRKFDFELVKFAKEAGAVFQESTPVTSVHILPDGVEVIVDQGQKIESETLIAADGVNSILARTMGLRTSGTEKGVCILQEFDVDEKIMDEYFKKSRHCYIHSRFKTVAGYGWVFPKKEHLNIGFSIIQIDKNQHQKLNMLTCYHEYLSLLKKENLIPKDLKDVPVKGGALLTRPLEKTYTDRSLVIGDAAGFVNPLTGEGIYYAMASGQIAAEILAEALEKKQINQEFLSQYQTRWQNDFGRDIDLILQVVKRGSMEYAEKVFKIAGKDPVLTELMMSIITGQQSVQQYKWKIVRRFFYSSLKNRLHLLK